MNFHYSKILSMMLLAVGSVATASSVSEATCGQVATNNVKHFGTIPANYGKLPTCKGFSLQASNAKAFSVFHIHGSSTQKFAEMWAECTSWKDNKNTYDMLLYTRPVKKGQGFTENYRCEDYQQMDCNELENVGSVVTNAQKEYLFITLHNELDDSMCLGLACYDSFPGSASSNSFSNSHADANDSHSTSFSSSNANGEQSQSSSHSRSHTSSAGTFTSTHTSTSTSSGTNHASSHASSFTGSTGTNTITGSNSQTNSGGSDANSQAGSQAGSQGGNSQSGSQSFSQAGGSQAGSQAGGQAGNENGSQSNTQAGTKAGGRA